MIISKVCFGLTMSYYLLHACVTAQPKQKSTLSSRFLKKKKNESWVSIHVFVFILSII